MSSVRECAQQGQPALPLVRLQQQPCVGERMSPCQWVRMRRTYSPVAEGARGDDARAVLPQNVFVEPREEEVAEVSRRVHAFVTRLQSRSRGDVYRHAGRHQVK
eukprot:GHVU01057166.1.p3 GENE.GHVU01057166.1~~GHVU01057166.1.p3  ORF type:complete len:104 (-),score=4.82 GHVU01057166.1:264-575(-)